MGAAVDDGVGDLEVAAKLGVDDVLRVEFVGGALAHEDHVCFGHGAADLGDGGDALVGPCAGAQGVAQVVGEFDEGVRHAAAGVGLQGRVLEFPGRAEVGREAGVVDGRAVAVGVGLQQA